MDEQPKDISFKQITADAIGIERIVVYGLLLVVFLCVLGWFWMSTHQL